MKDAFMIIAYPANDGNLVTLSPRIGSGHTEPAYTTEIDVPRYDVSSNANTAEGSDRGFSNIVAEGRCVKCLSWNGGSLDLTKTDQPFIFALGPPFPTVDSTDLSAGLNEHQFYGHFTMDMTAATSQSDANVPTGPYVRKDASQATDTNSDNNPASRIHGAVMGLVFVILLPLGAVLLRVWNKLKGHIIVQTIGLVLFCMAFAGGCVVSGLYIRSKNFNSAHQIIGILLLIAMLSQWPLGFLHHRIYKKEQRKTIMGKIHRYLGPVIIFFGVLNGGLGFQLAGEFTQGSIMIQKTLYTDCPHHRRQMARHPLRSHRPHHRCNLHRPQPRRAILPPPQRRSERPRGLPVPAIRRSGSAVRTTAWWASLRLSAAVWSGRAAYEIRELAECTEGGC
jgi:hypothetical protein